MTEWLTHPWFTLYLIVNWQGVERIAFVLTTFTMSYHILTAFFVTLVF